MNSLTKESNDKDNMRTGKHHHSSAHNGFAPDDDGNHISVEVFQHILDRQFGLQKCKNPRKLVSSFVSQHMPDLFQEKEFKMGKINKIFCSKWLDDKQVVLGTKCNKLLVKNLTSDQAIHIPSLKSSNDSIGSDCPCGIHTLAINPSRTLLATGAENTNDLAVYKLPTFDPVCVGECGHTDWIFDMVWVDDTYVVTGSRDSRLALWHVDQDDADASQLRNPHFPAYPIKKPQIIKNCDKAEKVRALAFHNGTKDLAALTLNSYFHLWDIETFTEKSYIKLPHPKENVCLALSEERGAYAIGSQSNVLLVDYRNLNITHNIQSKHTGCGIRSVSFRDDIVTIGTGVGHILFYDLRAGKYMDSHCGPVCTLATGEGYLRHDENYRNYFLSYYNRNALYTHCYDESGTRLFAAGGPLPAGLWGNYAGLYL